MLKVGLDARALGSSRKSGVANYIQQLATDLPGAANDIRFYYFLDRHTSFGEARRYRRGNVKIIWLPTRSEKSFMRWVSKLAKFYRLDLCQFPSGMIPDGFKGKAIINIYDLIYERFPQFYSPQSLQLQKTKVRESTQRADGIITISQSTKKDLQEFYGTAAAKIAVIYPIVTKNLSTNSAERPWPEPYLLAVGEIQPRKNFINLVKALALLTDLKIHLYIAGSIQDEAEHQRLMEVIKAKGLESRVHIGGYVTDAQLQGLYQHAEMLVFPSFYEGFGIPILEAFAHDIPVVTGQVASMPEAGGDAAVYVDSNSPESISTGIEKILADPKLKQTLVKRGREQLARFSQTNLAQETIAFYRQVVGAK